MKEISVKKIRNKRNNQSFLIINRKSLSKKDLEKFDKLTKMKIKIMELKNGK